MWPTAGSQKKTRRRLFFFFEKCPIKIIVAVNILRLCTTSSPGVD